MGDSVKVPAALLSNPELDNDLLADVLRGLAVDENSDPALIVSAIGWLGDTLKYAINVSATSDENLSRIRQILGLLQKILRGE